MRLKLWTHRSCERQTDSVKNGHINSQTVRHSCRTGSWESTPDCRTISSWWTRGEGGEPLPSVVNPLMTAPDPSGCGSDLIVTQIRGPNLEGIGGSEGWRQTGWEGDEGVWGRFNQSTLHICTKLSINKINQFKIQISSITQKILVWNFSSTMVNFLLLKQWLTPFQTAPWDKRSKQCVDLQRPYRMPSALNIKS